MASCTYNKSKSTITAKQIANIKEKFTSEEITYFYETVFFRDSETIGFKEFKRNTKVSKWNKDVIIKAFGNTNAFNMLELEKNVDYLASLGLLINIELTKKDNYNVELYFGQAKDIEKKTGRKIKYLIANGGFGNLQMDSLNVIKDAFVAIDNRMDTTAIYRKNRSLEELTQILGIFGDSYSHINSTFYQSRKNFKYQDQLFDIDYKVLKLLYSTDINVGLSINEFYEAFKDVIPNTKLNYASENSIIKLHVICHFLILFTIML